MFNYIQITLFILGLGTLTTANPSSSLSYGSSPTVFATAAGSSQIDVRNNYNIPTGYSTSIGYASPLTARIVAAASPIGYSSPVTRYSPTVLAGPFGYNAPSSLAARYESPFVGTGYASPYAATYAAAPYTASYTPFAANFVPPYTTTYGSPYAIAAPGSAPMLL